MSKISYATYIADRLAGFEGDSPRVVPADLEEYPSFCERLARSGGSPVIKRPRCVGPVLVRDSEPLRRDIDNMLAALKGSGAAEGFLNAASPGVVTVFQPNEYYRSDGEYLEAIADAMKQEYDAIVGAGLSLQIDCPDLAMGRHTRFKTLSEEEFLRHARLQVEVLNHALRDIDPANLRMHVCWGNYEGPHHWDIALEKILPIILGAKPSALLFESANPRHAHEWTLFKTTAIPDDKILVPGVIDTTTNFIEHPELVAERICRFADMVGRERVIAGTDCGFGTFASFGNIDPDICFAKLKTLARGAEIATNRLW